MSKRLTIVLAFALSLVSVASGQSTFEQWQANKLGLMVHWGLFSILQGDYQGKDYGKDAGYWGSDWIQINAKISKEEYAKLKARFNPVEFDAKEWVRTVKESGMGYLLMMAKHHEGFALFPSQASEYAINHTPYQADLMLALAEECQAQGILFGVYYSHSRDWYHRDNVRKSSEPSSEAYVQVVKTHMEELASTYPIDFFVFNTGDNQKAINTEYVSILKKHLPDCVVGGRISLLTDDQQFGMKGYKQVAKAVQASPVLTPVPLRASFGYDKNDDSWKSLREVIEHVSTAVSRGSHIALNVGVHPQGHFPEQDVDLLKQLGAWMQLNGEAIIGAQPSGLPDVPFGVLASKQDSLYAIVLDTSKPLKIAGVTREPKAVELLSSGKSLPYRFESGELLIDASALDAAEVEVVKVVFESNSPRRE